MGASFGAMWCGIFQVKKEVRTHNTFLASFLLLNENSIKCKSVLGISQLGGDYFNVNVSHGYKTLFLACHQLMKKAMAQFLWENQIISKSCLVNK